MAEELLSREFLDSVGAAFNRHDVDGIVGMFAPDGEWQLARGPAYFGTRLRGREEIRSFLQKRFASIPDMQWATLDRWAAGTKAVSEWRVTGSDKNGNRIDLLGCDLYTFNTKRLIVKKDTYWKSHEVAA
ncbi:MAG: nuclear transport factor 2 family protein [Alphaproteobacteria bacterium]|nr:nuclear transport factor 2 family protein [Alphaproteobacteria bacterium]